jgi:redox-sensitive bicupin YhaK (pirin superfamily)
MTGRAARARPDDEDRARSYARGVGDVVEPAVESAIELSESRDTRVGPMRVRRALPRRVQRTVGAWCFADHIGPADVAGPSDFGIGPHPHIGLQTVTWLLDGELRHRDSLGSDQVVRPGQLNLMTAGGGVAHSEDPTDHRGHFEGIQLWVAQPERTRHGPAAFEHHPTLPRVELDHGTGTVLVGELGGATSPARRDTDHFGVDLALRAGTTVVPLVPGHEHALVVARGRVEIEGRSVGPGVLATLTPGRDELALVAPEPARAVLLGGAPFEARPLMWWNFVARTREEVSAAQQEWNAAGARFGDVASMLDRIPAPALPWR